MIEQMFMPLDRHYDDGLAAIGDAFKESAEKLIEVHAGSMALVNGHLPINYLFRHAIELYLKSALLTVHRYFKLSTGEGPHQREPHIKISGKWRPLHSTHSLKTLLGELDRRLSDNKEKLVALTPTNWDTPAEVVAWIDLIEASDSVSTYFRYPNSKGQKVDGEKSGCLQADPEQLIAEMHERSASGKKGKMVLGLKDDDGNIVETFAMQENPLPELREALVGSAKALHGCAFGLHVELVDGYGAKMFQWRAEAMAKQAKRAPRKKSAKSLENAKKPKRRRRAAQWS